MRARPDPSIDASAIGEAPDANGSCGAEAARNERNRRWREANRAALAAYAREVEQDGLPLARFRSF